jgi:hypothetical protein
VNNMTKYAPVLSMLLMILGLLMFLFSTPMVGIYVFTAGAMILGIIRFVAFIRSRNSKEVSRIPQIHLLSVASLLGAAYMMYEGSNSWSVLLLVSAVIELYLSYRQK